MSTVIATVIAVLVIAFVVLALIGGAVFGRNRAQANAYLAHKERKRRRGSA